MKKTLCVLTLAALAGCRASVTMPPSGSLTPAEQAYADAVGLRTAAGLAEDLLGRREAIRKFPYPEQHEEKARARKAWEDADYYLREHLRGVAVKLRETTPPESMAEVHHRYRMLLHALDHGQAHNAEEFRQARTEGMTNAAEEFLVILAMFKADCAKRKGTP